METKDIINLALVGGIAFVAYKLLTSDFGDLFEQTLVAGGAAPETIAETGAVGGIGDIIYNIAAPSGVDLRKEATVPGGVFYEGAKTEITNILPPGQEPTPEQIVPRAVSMGAATAMHKEGFIASMLKAPITIGAGLGAITQQQKYYETLPEEARKKAVELEYTTRQNWVRGHPVESMIGFPALIAHAVTTPVPQTDFFSTLARGWGRIFG